MANNNNPQEYNLTEWKTYKLGDICDYVTSRTTRIENYISTENMLPNKGGVCAPSNVPSGTAIEYKVGDILISNIRPYFQKIWQADCNGACSADVLCIRANNKADSKYLYYLLSQQLFFDYVMSGAKGCKMPRGDKKQIMQWQISLPSLEEQRRIAGILGAIDDKIENNRRINTNLELQAQALFDNLMSNSNLEYKLIADIDHIIETGRRPKGGVANITSGVPSIGAENIKGLGKYDYSKTKYITAEFAETLKKGIIKGYELLIYKDGGKPGYFIPNFSIFGEGFPYDNMTLNEHVFLLDFGNKGYNFFAYFYMQTEEVMKYLNAQGSKAAIPGINRNDVENISIPTIENEAVKEFCERIEPIITSILVNSKESSRLATLRDTLLPKLMNGEIKVAE